MSKKEKLEYVRAGLRGYARLSQESRDRTSRETWIALKLGCSLPVAARYIREAEAEANQHG